MTHEAIAYRIIIQGKASLITIAVGNHNKIVSSSITFNLQIRKQIMCGPIDD